MIYYFITRVRIILKLFFLWKHWVEGVWKNYERRPCEVGPDTKNESIYAYVIWTKRHRSYNILQCEEEKVVKIIKRCFNSCHIEVYYMIDVFWGSYQYGSCWSAAAQLFERFPFSYYYSGVIGFDSIRVEYLVESLV